MSVTTWVAAGLAFATGAAGAPPEAPVEAPALATFRALTPPTGVASPTPTTEVVRRIGTGPSTARADRCPCIGTQAQWRRGEGAGGADPPSRLSWGSADRPRGDVRSPGGDMAVRTARPLVLISDTGPRVGVFLVSPADR